MKSPCYKCENRTMMCHANCEQYLAFRKEKDVEIAMRIEKNAMWDSHKKKRRK